MSASEVELDLQEYTTHELFALFKLSDTNQLTTDHLFQAKQIAMRIHPDKSGLDPQYFRFFWEAYNALVTIHEYQVGGYATQPGGGEVDAALTEEQMALLDRLFHSREELRDPKHFNRWFNEQFPSTTSINNDDFEPSSLHDWSNASAFEPVATTEPRIRSVDALSRARRHEIQPMSQHAAAAELAANDRRSAAASADRAFKHVQQTHRSHEQQQAFWKRLKLLT
jgi:hypothetical protein